MLHPIVRRPVTAATTALPLLLAACASPALPPTARPQVTAAAAPPSVQPVEVEPRAVATQIVPLSPGPVAPLLAYADRLRSLSPGDLSAEINRLGEPGDSPAAQVQLALALAQTRAPADLARALGLMQRAAGNNSPDGLALQPLARLMAARYQEQRRVEDERDRQAQQQKEAQRRIDQLNDRLEALRAIERSFGRHAPAPAPPSAAPVAPPNGAKP